MNREKKTIELINSIMPRSNNQLNHIFESDSEIIKFNDKKILLTTDKFDEEDFFRDNDPYILGHNIGIASITDIFAVGGKPLYLINSLTVSNKWSDEYIRKFIIGIKDILKKSSIDYLGGDISFASDWSCVTTLFGICEDAPLLRSNAKPEDFVYITGRIGIGNFEAGLKIYQNVKLLNNIKNKFCLRTKESAIIKKYSKCCIDTSDGTYNAIKTICEQSNIGCEINQLPFIKNNLIISRMFSMPVLLLFLGECGEYELLFTIDKVIEKDFLNEARQKKLKFYKLGKMTSANEIILKQHNKIIDLNSFNISARDYKNKKDYLKKIINFLNKAK